MSELIKGVSAIPIPRYYQYGDFSSFAADFELWGRPRNFLKGESLKPPGVETEKLYYIKRGLARLLMVHPSGGVKTLIVAGSGCILPFFYPRKMPLWEASMFVEAYMKLETIEIDRSQFQSLAERFHELKDIMAMVVARTLYTVACDDMSHIYDEGITRVCNLLYMHLNNKQVKHNHPINVMAITQYDVGALVGLNRVNTNKILQQLQNEKIIKIERRHIEIINPQGLLQYCSESLVIGE